MTARPGNDPYRITNMEKRQTPARHPGDAPAAGTCDFDRPIDRRGTNSVKYDTLAEHFGRGDLLPMWVADMDFETPDFIVGALRQRLEHPLYGYTAEPADYRPAITDWIRTHHGWEVRGEWIAYIPGIVKGIGLVIDRFVGKDEKVIIQPPVYHPPSGSFPRETGRQVVLNPLREHPAGATRWTSTSWRAWRTTDAACCCSPTRTIRAASSGTRRRCAGWPPSATNAAYWSSPDEIHCDMALWDNRHTPFASVSEAAARCSITFGAPTKTFNIAGIVSSYAIVPDETLRNRFFRGSRPTNSTHPTFAPIATVAAFREGEAWRRQMLRYVEGNVELVIGFCAEHLPAIRPLRPQASFLVWLDCRGLGLRHEELQRLFIDEARLALNDGALFGREGEGFMRLNVGAPRAVVREALERLRDAVARTVK